MPSFHCDMNPKGYRMPEIYDLIIKNSRIADGTGRAVYRSDIGIRNGKIVSLCDAIENTAAGQVLSAKGLTAVPGFIDAHSHDDFFPLIKPSCEEKVVQGVTTTVIGNCGFSPAPMTRQYAAALKDSIRTIDEIRIAESDLNTFDDFLNILEKSKPGINILPLVGHGTIRIAAMGVSKRPPTGQEMTHMKESISEAMKAGAFGMSTGLSYVPGEYAAAAEIRALAEVVADFGGIYTSHIRNERDGVVDAVKEAIAVGASAKIPVQISHLKVAGKNNWGRSREVLEAIEAAIADGIEITCDVYPYDAASTGLTALLPPHLFTEGYPAFSQKLKDTGFRRKLVRELEDNDGTGWEDKMKGTGFDNILIIGSSKFQSENGRSVSEIARRKEKNAYDVIFDIIAEEGNAVSVILFAMAEEDIRRIIAKPFVMIGSDGGPKVDHTFFHPRFTGTFPRVFSKYVRQDKLFGLEEAVCKMTSLPAQTFGLTHKGVIKPGFDADIVIIDPEKITDQSTFENPSQKPEGVEWVIVNGKIASERGTVTQNRAGKVLRKSA
jgi:N-acyl-D-amino-acid deacylase